MSLINPTGSTCQGPGGKLLFYIRMISLGKKQSGPLTLEWCTDRPNIKPLIHTWESKCSSLKMTHLFSHTAVIPKLYVPKSAAVLRDRVTL